jgi:putative ABC transport system permease protein
MFKNYLKTAIRGMFKNKLYSFINIAGLSAGMAVAIVIGLWIWDELQFDKQNPANERIAAVIQTVTNNGKKDTWQTIPFPLGEELRKSYGSDFKYVVLSTWNQSHVLTVGEKNFKKNGLYLEPQGPYMLNLQMLYGSKDGLKNPASILLSQEVAEAYFGNTDPMNKMIKIDNGKTVKVTGVYKNMPNNSSFADMAYIMPWQLMAEQEDLKSMDNPWRPNSFRLFVQLADNADMAIVSAKIKDVKMQHVHQDELIHKPQLFLHPMAKWHLYSNFKNGVNIGGRIQYVWLFGITGLFVLLLACINFMNLTTARSEKRAKEVGIRKAIGSLRKQLVYQFFSESLLVAFIAFVFALALVQVVLPFFNSLAGKNVSLPLAYPAFWVMGIGFTVVTGIISGSYPALYLSSFQPVKVLKGTFKAGRFAALPRKVLVVMQFTVSVILIIGTLVVFRQIQFAKNRPVGYSRNGLVMLPQTGNELHSHFKALRDDLIKSGAVTEMAESWSPVTGVWSTNSGFNWAGKDAGLAVDFPNTGISPGYGKTVGWQFAEGRDFSEDFLSDSAAFVINETAAKFMGLKHPVGETVTWDGTPYKIVGVIKDMVVESPYEPVRPSIYHIANDGGNFIFAKINPASSMQGAIEKIEATVKKYSPAQPFDYQFADAEFARKFGDEERIGKLAAAFSILAIFISCLGLFGMASFMAEQRVKEIGVRKVLGASTINLWGLLSRDFVVLVVLSLLIAIPVAYYSMYNWLQGYQYRSGMPWWLFAATGAGALFITLLTVSWQSIKAAQANPVKSLKTE